MIDELIKYFPSIDKEAFKQKKKRWICILESMTREERLNSKILKKNRKKRIAIGSGMDIQEINNLLKFYFTLKKQFKRLSKIRNKKKIIRELMYKRK